MKGVGEPCGDNYVGYEDNEFYYLRQGLIFSKIKEYYDNQGMNFTVTNSTLLKLLDSEGLIFSTINDGQVVRTHIKNNQRVIKLYKNKVIQ